MSVAQKRVFMERSSRAGDLGFLLEQLSHLPELPLNIPKISVWDKGAPKCIYMPKRNKLVKISGNNMSKRLVQRYFVGEKCAKPGQKGKHSNEILINGYKVALRCISSNPTNESSIDTQLLTEKALIEILVKWPTEKLKKIRYIHSCIRVSGSDQRVIYVQYNAHEKVSETQKRAKVCMEMCETMCESIKKHCEIEIEEMRAEFFTSETEYWLNNAWQIRYKVKRVIEVALDVKVPVFNYEKVSKKVLLNRLESHGIADNGDSKTSEVFIGQMYDIMGSQLELAKEVTGLNAVLQPDPPNYRSNQVFKQVRPDCKFLFTDLLNPDFDPRQKFDQEMIRKYAGYTKKQVVKSILKDEEMNKVIKLELPKSAYGSLVKENLRIIHHAVPKDLKNYQEFNESIVKLKSITGLTKSRHNSISLSQLPPKASIRPRSSVTLRGSKDKRNEQIINDDAEKVIGFIVRNRSKQVSRYFKI